MVVLDIVPLFVLADAMVIALAVMDALEIVGDNVETLVDQVAPILAVLIALKLVVLVALLVVHLLVLAIAATTAQVLLDFNNFLTL